MKRVLFLGICCAMATLQAAVDFELLNKAPERIWLRLTNGTEVVRNGDFDFFTSNPGTTLQIPLKRTEKTLLEVWKKNIPFKLIYEKYTPGAGTRNVAARPADLTYRFPAGKTLYLTFDDKGIRPQTGPWLGTLGVTKSGLSLRNNISMSEIKKS